MSDDQKYAPEARKLALQLCDKGWLYSDIALVTGVPHEQIKAWDYAASLEVQESGQHHYSKSFKRAYVEEFFARGFEEVYSGYMKYSREKGVSMGTLQWHIRDYRAGKYAPPRLDPALIAKYRVAHPFTIFKEKMFKRLEKPTHLNFLDSALEGLESGQHGRLIVSMPVRHGKTFTVSRLFPAWYLGRHPQHRIILASHTAALAYKNNRLVRNLMLSPTYQDWSGGVRPALPREGAATMQSWDIVDQGGLTGGGMDAVGVGAAIAGMGAQLIIVDDVVSLRADVESRLQRDKLWDWFISDLYTRREPGANVVIVMTRWHMDDLIGRVLREMPDEWEYIRLPALAEENDPMGRRVGDALWAERFPRAELIKTQEVMGDYAFAGLYQQRPIPAEGNLFRRKDFIFVDTADNAHDPIVRKVRYWDLAWSDSENADFSVGTLMGATESGRAVIMDVVRVRMRSHDVELKIIETGIADGIDVAIGIENAAGGAMAIKTLVKALNGYSIRAYTPKGVKTARAMPLSTWMQAGLVTIMQGGWTRDFMEELCAFPSGLHDDQIDSAAGALLMIGEMREKKRLEVKMQPLY